MRSATAVNRTRHEGLSPREAQPRDVADSTVSGHLLKMHLFRLNKYAKDFVSHTSLGDLLDLDWSHLHGTGIPDIPSELPAFESPSPSKPQTADSTDKHGNPVEKVCNGESEEIANEK